MSRSNSQNLWISIHIPKTGGQTFERGMKLLAQGGLVRDYRNRPVAEDAHEIRLRQAAMDAERMNNLQYMLGLGRGRVIVHGHFLASKYRAYFPDASYLCWIRDPIERVCSHYAYWCRESSINQGRSEAEMPGLLEFAEEPRHRDVQSTFVNDVRMEVFDFLGITQHYSRSMRLFRAWSGTELPELTPVNQNPERDQSSYVMDSETRSQIEKLNARDIELYERAMTHFEELCRIHGVDACEGG